MKNYFDFSDKFEIMSPLVAAAKIHDFHFWVAVKINVSRDLEHLEVSKTPEKWTWAVSCSITIM